MVHTQRRSVAGSTDPLDALTGAAEVSKQYGLRRRLKRLAKAATGVPVPKDWTLEQIADAIADVWNSDLDAPIQPPVTRGELLGRGDDGE
jgi:hypothetical protein